MQLFVTHCVQLILFYHVSTDNLQLLTSHSFMCAILGWLLHLLCHMFYYFLSSFACFSLLHSLFLIVAFAHDISHTLLCNFIIIRSCKIPLFICYVTSHGCMYDAVVTIEMCLSIDDINKFSAH
jgi:hypothetical protein